MKTIQFLRDKIIAPLVVTLLNNIVYPLVAPILTLIIIGIASKITTGDRMKWFGRISTIIWIIFGVFLCLWFILIVIRKRIKEIQKLNDDRILAASNPTFGWTSVGEFNYSGVVWVVRVPAPAPWDFGPSKISPSSIDVETPPRCPKCKTELEQSHSFWGGYVWKCVGCELQKRNRDSYYREAERAKKIARREWEKRQEHESSDS